MSVNEAHVKVPLGDLSSGSPIHFSFVRDGQPLSGFLITHDGDVHAYVNRCPHIAVSLDFGDGILMDPTNKFIQCQVHGAQFLPESGECFWGPPLGERLERLPVSLTDTHACVNVIQSNDTKER